MMFDEEIINQLFIKRQEKIEDNIQKEYHKRVKIIKEKNEEERNNIKMNIISELYYKQGFKDAINFIIKGTKK